MVNHVRSNALKTQIIREKGAQKPKVSDFVDESEEEGDMDDMDNEENEDGDGSDSDSIPNRVITP